VIEQIECPGCFGGRPQMLMPVGDALRFWCSCGYESLVDANSNLIDPEGPDPDTSGGAS
jgi:hypothetical protein